MKENTVVILVGAFAAFVLYSYIKKSVTLTSNDYYQNSVSMGVRG